MTDQATEQQHDQGAEIKELRAAAARAKELERELAEVRRSEAFRKAGIDPDDKRNAYFVKGYDGDLTQDAIQAEAREAGFLAEPGPSQEQQQQLDGMDRIGQVVSRSTPTEGQDYEAQLVEAMQQGGVAGLEQAVRQLGIPIQDD